MPMTVGSQIHQEITRRQIVVRSLMEIDTLEEVLAMVANGLGSSVMPARTVDYEFPKTIRAIPFGKPRRTQTRSATMPASSEQLHDQDAGN